MSGQRIIVIGAGIAGLVAARRLSQAGHAVRVLEAADTPGGRVGTREVRGIRFNTGARLVYPFSKPFNALLDELGLTRALIPIRHLSADCVGRDGRWTVELMPGPKSLLTPGLSMAERLRFITFGLKLLASRSRTDPDDAATAPGTDGQTLADYITQNLGPGVLERMVEPIFRGTRSWNAEDISAGFFATTTPHLIGRSAVHVFAGGMDRLPFALAEGLMIDCGVRVTAVDQPADGPVNVHADTGAGAVRHEADLIVCATEGSLTPALFPAMEEERAFLTSVRYNALGIVHYRLNRQVAPAMQFFTRDVAGPIATWQQVPGNEATGLPPQLYAQLSPEAVEEAAERGLTERLHDLIAPRVRELYPTLDQDCTDMHNQWIARKLPVFYPGYGRAMAAFRDRQSAMPRRVYFCGDYLAQSLITGAAASGERTARDITRHWGQGEKQP